MPIKSFRGLMAADTIAQINLHTNNGATGYRIVKFELINEDPRGADTESVVKIYKTPQTAVDDKIDFSDNTLLAAGFYENDNHGSYFGGKTIVFDSEVFNQDLYLTASPDASINYYIELEQVKLDLNENTVATLKDIRNITQG